MCCGRPCSSTCRASVPAADWTPSTTFPGRAHASASGDVFHQTPLESLDWRTPDQVYDQMAGIGHNGGPRLLDSQDDVETLFGIVRTGTLNHRGLRFEGLYYSSDEA